MAGVRAQFAHTVADVLNLSRTGALLRANCTLRLRSEWPLLIELPAGPVRLTGRVVRCQPAHASNGSPQPRNQYAIAVSFLRAAPEAQAVLDAVCGAASEGGG